MVTEWKLPSKAVLVAAFTMFVVSGIFSEVHAQNIMRLRFDTITAKPGETVTMTVYDSFTATRGHNIQDVRVRMTYDTNLVYAVRYILDSTAMSPFSSSQDTMLLTSHVGIVGTHLFSGETQELDVTNPVLLKIQFRVDSTLTDTAWIRWDSNYKFVPGVFEFASDSVDSVTFQDGWIRVPQKMAVLPAASQPGRLTLFPNPARDEVTVGVPEERPGAPFGIEVFDALGRLRWNGTLVGPEWNIPGSLAAGTYEVRVHARGVFYQARLMIEPR